MATTVVQKLLSDGDGKALLAVLTLASDQTYTLPAAGGTLTVLDGSNNLVLPASMTLGLGGQINLPNAAGTKTTSIKNSGDDITFYRSDGVAAVNINNVSMLNANGGLTTTTGTFTSSAVSPVFTTGSSVAYSGATTGSLFYNSALGTTLQAKTGSEFDMVFLNAGGTLAWMQLPIGSNIPRFNGGITVIGTSAIQALTATTGSFTGSVSAKSSIDVVSSVGGSASVHIIGNGGSVITSLSMDQSADGSASINNHSNALLALATNNTNRLVISAAGYVSCSGGFSATTVQATAANGYKSSDGSSGLSTTITTSSLVGKTITVKDGIITSFA